MNGPERNEPHGQTPPLSRLHDLLQRLELAGQYQRAARARQLGMHQVELSALEHLATAGGLTPGELGHRLGLTSGGVTALARRLIDAGAVRRSPHPHDRRMRVLAATEEGRERLDEYLESVVASADEGLDRLSLDDVEQLGQLLEPLVDAKERAATETPGPPPERTDDGFTRALLM